MRKQITLEKAKGRVVEGFAFSNINKQMVVTLSGNGFICLGVSLGYEPGEESIQPQELAWMEFGAELVNGGVWSEQELDEYMNKHRRTLKTMRERAERETYERLKEKFEGGADAQHP